MRWVEEMNERAELMQRMLKTIGAMDRVSRGMFAGPEMREAMDRCKTCGEAESCRQWLDDHADGTLEPPELCPNAALFHRWAGDVTANQN